MSTFLHDIEFLGLMKQSGMIATATADWLFVGYLVQIGAIEHKRPWR